VPSCICMITVHHHTCHGGDAVAGPEKTPVVGSKHSFGSMSFAAPGWGRPSKTQNGIPVADANRGISSCSVMMSATPASKRFRRLR